MPETEPDDRRYPARPIVGVGGLILNGNAVLLVQRGKEPGRGRWSIPGGGVRVGEALADGLIREMAEETGLDVSAGPLVEVVERIFYDESGRVIWHYVIMDYLCRIEGGTLRAGSDAMDAAFVPPEQWPDYDLAPDAVRVLEKALCMAREAGPLSGFNG
jgi:ADP-ribose pyrophosphatase YjhB (NUDIX family)